MKYNLNSRLGALKHSLLLLLESSVLRMINLSAHASYEKNRSQDQISVGLS